MWRLEEWKIVSFEYTVGVNYRFIMLFADAQIFADYFEIVNRILCLFSNMWNVFIQGLNNELWCLSNSLWIIELYCCYNNE